MIKDISKTLPKIKIIGYFYNIFGNICPVCNKNIEGKNFCHTTDHTYFYDSMTLSSHDDYYLCFLSENKIQVSIKKNKQDHYKIVYSDFIDSSDKNLIKNAKQIFNSIINNIMFL